MIKIAKHVKPFLEINGIQYFKYNGNIYSKLSNLCTAYDLDTGMPLCARWLCSELFFDEILKKRN